MCRLSIFTETSIVSGSTGFKRKRSRFQWGSSERDLKTNGLWGIRFKQISYEREREQTKGKERRRNQRDGEERMNEKQRRRASRGIFILILSKAKIIVLQSWKSEAYFSRQGLTFALFVNFSSQNPCSPLHFCNFKWWNASRHMWQLLVEPSH